MKKIAALIATTLAAASSANAIINTIQGSLTGHSLREPFSVTGMITPGIATSGNYSITLDNAGIVVNSGSMTIDYNLQGNANGYAYDVDYTGVTYSLSSASGEVLDHDYNGQGLWLGRFSWGYSLDNTVNWGTTKTQTQAAGRPNDVRDTNGSYQGNRNGNNPFYGNGTLQATGGSSSCIGNGCGMWSTNSFGIEGLAVYVVVDPNAYFAVIDNWITMQEVIGISQPFQISITSVPVPAAAWLMGSGLLGLAGIARRKQRG